VAALGKDVTRLQMPLKGIGGAIVSVLIEKMTDDNDGLINSVTQFTCFTRTKVLILTAGELLQDHSRRAAITRIVIAAEREVTGYLKDGYSLLDKNLLEQTGRGALYLMYHTHTLSLSLSLSHTHSSTHTLTHYNLYIYKNI
jgi:hypothetical protein